MVHQGTPEHLHLHTLTHARVSGEELPPVEDLEVRPRGGQMELQWRTSKRSTPSEFVVEWTRDGEVDWQREPRGTTNTVIRGDLLLNATT